jgi:hypothetical protein
MEFKMRKYSKLSISLLLFTILGCTCVSASTADTASLKLRERKPPANRHQQDKVSADPFSWLGPLPKVLNEKVTSEAFHRVFKRLSIMMESEIREDVNLKYFVCRRPAEVGPVPQQQVLEKFVAEWPNSRSNPTSLIALIAAARDGNWLARSWLFPYMLEYTTDPVLNYRRSQLMDLLLNDKAAILYSFMSSFYGASGSGGMNGSKPDIFETYAALHNSYPAQYRVGQYLRHSEVPEEADAGERMVSCAMNGVPGYGDLLEKEKNSLNMMTF